MAAKFIKVNLKSYLDSGVSRKALIFVIWESMKLSRDIYHSIVE